MKTPSAPYSPPPPHRPEVPTEREKLALFIRVILRQFYRPESTAIEDATELTIWLDMLGDASCDELRGAWKAYQQNGARTERGALLRPDAGALAKLITAERNRVSYEKSVAIARLSQVFDPVDEAPRISGQRAMEIMAEVWGEGFSLSGIGALVKGFPKAGEGAE